MWTESILKKFRIKNAGDDDPETDKDKEKDKKPVDDPEDQDKDKDEDDDGPDFDSLDDKTKKYIKKLRDENKSRRTETNNLTTKMEKFEKGFKAMFGDEEDDKDPEQVLNTLKGQFESSVSENAILRLAVENGISGVENLEYFEFLMAKKLNSLEEGEEMTEEDLDDILSKCSKGAGGKANTSTKDAGKGGGKDPGKSGDEVTQEEFNKMTITQKSNLYNKNPALYEKLMKNSTMR